MALTGVWKELACRGSDNGLPDNNKNYGILFVTTSVFLGFQ